MILIADSGSFKTSWAILDNSNLIQFTTCGLNPFFTGLKDLQNVLNSSFPENIPIKKITEIYFYGAGCSNKSQRNKMAEMLSSFFKNTGKIVVDTDLMGAAIALLNKDKGIIGIIGTGTNCGFFDGEKILQIKPSLGYILGDEGSGAWLGKKLLQLYLNNDLPENLRINFEKRFNKIGVELISELYTNSRPNMYLADFAVFYAENKNYEILYNIIKEGFNKFLQNYLIHYTTRYSLPVSFCGSIAYIFSDILKESLLENNIRLKQIIQSPIEKLTKKYIS